MHTVRFAAVGGFLGAGKTTLLSRVAERLSDKGKRVGFVTNDQGHQLVDTQTVEQREVPVVEVVGGCFCCRFDDLVAAAKQLVEGEKVELLFAEPVGSCTDLVATVYRPLAEFYGDRFRLCPLTVLAEPGRIHDLEAPSRGGFSEKVRRLFLWQLQEADVLALSKADLVSDAELAAMLAKLRQINPTATVMALSSETEEGIDDWLDFLANHEASRQAKLDVDYQLYAQAEAELGWLNTAVHLDAAQPFIPEDLIADLLARLKEICQAQSAPIAHVKASLTCPSCPPVRGHLVRVGEEPELAVSAGCALTRGEMLLNARVSMEPEALLAAAHDAIESACRQHNVHWTYGAEEAFAPLPPRPTHRIMAPAG